ncbi:MAG TPA: VWA domain-containing protein [Pyrinomonadaceae bacterium]|nr:VWA domain-containing protein [Pyrinomonadaceae bacterium]
MLSAATSADARRLFSALLCLALTAQTFARAQDPPAPPADSEEVVRITSDLIQTDVMVFDKSGNFVEGLKGDDFELKVEGKPQQVVFFERINAGSLDEDAQLAAARGGATRPGGGAAVPLDRGRTIFFFLDDLHIAPGNVTRTRQSLERFIEQEVGQNDEAAIVSASGQIGFLQQLTSEKAVLRAALKKFNARAGGSRDFDSPPMNEVQALAIERNDQQVVNYFVDALLREYGRIPRSTAENIIRGRASNIMRQSAALSATTLASLLNLVRRTSPLPGRKIVFFISDGFVMNSRSGDERENIRRISDAAARAGVVVYSLQASGLTTGLPDISDRTNFDPTGQLASVNAGETTAMQEPLRSVAADTGGRALLNTNAMNFAVTRALKETARYYLLAWRPDGAEAGRSKFQKLQIGVRNRPELNVVVRRGFFTEPETQKASDKKSKDEANKRSVAKTPDSEIVGALGGLYPRTALPTALSLGYTSAPDASTVLTASVEVDSDALTFVPAEGGAKRATADIGGVVFSDEGKPVTSARQDLHITQATGGASGPRPPAIYSFQFRLNPGLYQVRFAARDRQTGRIGSAMQWIEIPDLKRSGFTLSSLFIGERPPDESAASGGGQQDPLTRGLMLIAPDRRFPRTTSMRFTTYIYNAKWSAAAPVDVALQVQVFRDDQPVITTPLSRVKTDGLDDFSRIPYAAEIALAQLPPGRYALQVTAIDRAAKQSASRRISFMVE